MVRGPLPRGGIEESVITGIIPGTDVVSVNLAGGTGILFDRDDKDVRLFCENDDALLDYHRATPDCIRLTVKREGREIFRGNIPATRIVALIGAITA